MSHKLQPGTAIRVMLVGEFIWPWYEQACAEALGNLGFDVVPASYFDKLWKYHANSHGVRPKSLAVRLQNRLKLGPVILAIELAFITRVISSGPQIVWLYNAQHIRPWALRLLRALGKSFKLILSSQDNPFSLQARKTQWRHFLKLIPLADLNLVFRDSNLDAVISAGAKNADTLYPFFVPKIHFANPGSSSEDSTDIVFVGHYEDDQRIGCLEALMEKGLSVRVHGGGWDRAEGFLRPDSPIRALFPITPAIGEEYRRAVWDAKLSLCFLSTLNQDVMTSRNFEIPSMGAVMVSQRSDTLTAIFRSGEEALFFDSCEELVELVAATIHNDVELNRIAAQGFERVHELGADVQSRIRDVFLRNSEVLGLGHQ